MESIQGPAEIKSAIRVKPTILNSVACLTCGWERRKIKDETLKLYKEADRQETRRIRTAAAAEIRQVIFLII